MNAAVDFRLLPAVAFYWGFEHPPYEDFAGNLKGKLLMISGMLDGGNTPVSGSFRLVAALKKANKRFDMLFLPDEGHGASDYAYRCAWDYLVEHLLGLEPPENFALNFSSPAKRIEASDVTHPISETTHLECEH